MSNLYLGLISGTSVDGVDAALIDFSNKQFKLLATHCEPIAPSLKKDITALCEPGNNEIDRMGVADNALGELFSNAANTLLDIASINSSQIAAIGSHGQTIRHRPPTRSGEAGFTLQIANADIIAQRTGITTVANFRARDMALGGQGAPFAPAFHQAISPANLDTSAFLNLGGIANITLVHKGKLVQGFDTGPANGLMDAWIARHKNKPYDAKGQWGLSGTPVINIQQKLLADDYFKQAAPKSTGREYFNLAWLNKNIKNIEHYSPEDVQATLLSLSVQSISDALSRLPHKPDKLFYCGGGAHNTTFIEALEASSPDIAFASTDELGIGPDWIEACTFAWLAHQTLMGNKTSLGKITGASSDYLAGAIYPA